MKEFLVNIVKVFYYISNFRTSNSNCNGRSWNWSFTILTRMSQWKHWLFLLSQKFHML